MNTDTQNKKPPLPPKNKRKINITYDVENTYGVGITQSE
jgi:hypothetical protein